MAPTPVSRSLVFMACLTKYSKKLKLLRNKKTMSKNTFLKDTPQNTDNTIVTGKYKGKWPKNLGM